MPLSKLEAAPSGKITVRLMANEVPDGQGKIIIQADKKNSKPLDLPINQLSEPIAVSARAVVLAAADGDTPLCKITLPDAGKSFAVLLVSEEPASYVPFVVRTDDRAFKDGDVFFVNHTTKAIVLKLGATELVIEPGKSATSRPTKPEDNAYQIVISERSGDGDKLISSTRWPVETGIRSYVFLTEKAGGKTTYRAVDEYVEAGK